MWYKTYRSDYTWGPDTATVAADFCYEIRFGKRCEFETYKDGEYESTVKLSLIEIGPSPTLGSPLQEQGFHRRYRIQDTEKDEIDYIFYQEGYISITSWPREDHSSYTYLHYFRKK